MSKAVGILIKEKQQTLPLRCLYKLETTLICNERGPDLLPTYEWRPLKHGFKFLAEM
jgi:hypothetical protein